MLNIALFGPPGAGKGTQSEFLISKYNLFYISTGDLLRKEISETSRLGLEAQSSIASGGLVSDEIIVQIIEKTIEQFMATVPGTQLLVDEIPQENEFSGTVGFPGKVTGRVALLYRQEQIKGIPEGAILASPMTTPDFLPALQRAAAFITDEGGMLSHAAIVARELRKPCIIGTKIATQVLHDGDLVEVDADQGVVRIIRELEVVSKSAISGQ